MGYCQSQPRDCPNWMCWNAGEQVAQSENHEILTYRDKTDVAPAASDKVGIEEEKKEAEIFLRGIKDHYHFIDDETGDESYEALFPIQSKRDNIRNLITVTAKFTWRHDRRENWISVKTSKPTSKKRQR